MSEKSGFARCMSHSRSCYIWCGSTLALSLVVGFLTGWSIDHADTGSTVILAIETVVFGAAAKFFFGTAKDFDALALQCLALEGHP